MNSIYTQKFYLSDKNWIIQNKITHVLEVGDGFSHAYIIVHQYFDLQAETHTHTNKISKWAASIDNQTCFFFMIISLSLLTPSSTSNLPVLERGWKFFEESVFTTFALLCMYPICVQLWQEWWWTHNRGRSERGMYKQKLPFSLNTSRSSTSLNYMECALLLCALPLGFPLVIIFLLLLLCLIAMHVLSLPEQILSE